MPCELSGQHAAPGRNSTLSPCHNQGPIDDHKLPGRQTLPSTCQRSLNRHFYQGPDRDSMGQTLTGQKKSMKKSSTQIWPFLVPGQWLVINRKLLNQQFFKQLLQCSALVLSVLLSWRVRGSSAVLHTAPLRCQEQFKLQYRCRLCLRRIGTDRNGTRQLVNPNGTEPGGWFDEFSYFHKIWTDDLISNFIIYIYTRIHTCYIYICMYIPYIVNYIMYVCIYICVCMYVFVCVSVCVCVCAFNYSICLFQLRGVD